MTKYEWDSLVKHGYAGHDDKGFWWLQYDPKRGTVLHRSKKAPFV